MTINCPHVSGHNDPARQPCPAGNEDVVPLTVMGIVVALVVVVMVLLPGRRS